MSMDVILKNPRSGEIKKIKVGFSWTIFFFGGVFGLPLFMRQLNSWGLVMVALNIGFAFSGGIMMIPALVIQTYLSFKGNELTAKNLLDKGWVFSEPESDSVKIAKTKWDLVLEEQVSVTANN